GGLAPVSLMVAGWRGGPELPGIPADGWVVAHEGLVPWPAYDNLPEPERTPECPSRTETRAFPSPSASRTCSGA
ncbi:MAG TPA: hypothetical protein PKA93_06385, partial [Arachnia sp.]|nr:hypothetical protein [Arachnia sp.]